MISHSSQANSPIASTFALGGELVVNRPAFCCVSLSVNLPDKTRDAIKMNDDEMV